jgi:phosphatidylinositol alpha-1,6-mannosyltransferase
VAGLLAHAHDYRLHGQVACVGSLLPQRDGVALVRAFHALAGDFPGLRLMLIGHIYCDAAVRLARRLGLAERVRFPGELPHEQVLAELRRSDVHVVCLNGRYVGLGTAALESMLLGVPVIANVAPDLLGEPLLRDGENYVRAEGGAGALQAALRRLLGDEALRRRVGQGGRALVREHLSWEQVAREMETVLHQVAGR